jgi:transcriptional regulator with XRE-family HTH domain
LTLGKRVREIRKQRQLTQKEVAEKTGISQAFISEIENDKKVPGGDILKSLLQFFEIEANWLLSGEGEIKDRVAREVVAESETCYLKGVLHLSERELRLIAAFRQFDEDFQESKVRDFELMVLGVRESRGREKPEIGSEAKNFEKKSNG